MEKFCDGKNAIPCWVPHCPGCDYSAGNGRTNNQIHRVFMLVAKKGDWKAPIRALTNLDAVRVASALPNLTVAEARRLVEIAVAYNTATEAYVEVCAQTHFKVKAIGYRMGPAGDH